LNTRFIFRTLDESELEHWFDHCATVFAKKTVREYFVRHWNCDPERDIKGIFVAVDTSQNNQIAATVRIFFRKMKIGGYEFKMGGIGEVSTKEAYRHQGLATKLLNLALEYMNERDIEISSLHTSEAAPLYRKCGFESIPRYFYLQYIDPKLSPDFVKKIEWKFLDTISKSRIKHLYSITSSLFNGTIERSRDDYWDLWVANETPTAYIFFDRSRQQIVGYLAMRIQTRRTPVTFEVREFTSSAFQQNETDAGQSSTVQIIFETLVAHAVADLLADINEPKIHFEKDSKVLVAYPSPLGNLLISQRSPNVLRDDGTMFKIINEEKLSPEKLNAFRTFRGQELNAMPIHSKHVFWTTDSF
jgi:GNAT superfamily N-acetyltransferase